MKNMDQSSKLEFNSAYNSNNIEIKVWLIVRNIKI